MNSQQSTVSASGVLLRPVLDTDLPIFFRQQLDPEANFMAAFTVVDPSDREAFDARWQRMRADDTIHIRTIVQHEHVIGSVLSYEEDDRVEVSYWLGKEYCGQGFASRALALFVAEVATTRPLFARVAQDNLASLHVLQRCGFTVVGEDSGFANARQAEVTEFVLSLGSP